MVGEIRDLETAEMAIQAALTGHLVLSTLHTNDAPSAITPAARTGRSALPDQGDRARRDGAAAGANAVPALQDNPKRSTQRPGKLLTRPWQGAAAAQCHAAGRLPRMPRHRLSRSHGRVRNHAADRRAAGADQGRERLADVAPAGASRTACARLRLSGAQKVGAGMTTIAEVLRVTPSSQND